MLEANLGRALQFYRRGKLADAEQICLALLRQSANYCSAMYLLGTIALRTSRAKWAIELMESAISMKPDQAEAHCILGDALRSLGQMQDALSSYNHAIALQPILFDAWCGRGQVLGTLGQHEAAVSSHDKAIIYKPDHAEAHYNRAKSLRCLGRVEAALSSFNRVIALQPGHADAHFDRGEILGELGRLVEALASYNRAIEVKSDCAEAFNNRGDILRILGRFQEALSSYDQAVSLRPDLYEAYFNRGNLHWDLGHSEVALSNYDRAISLQPNFAKAYNNRGAVQESRGQFEAALQSYGMAVKLNCSDADMLVNRGNALRYLDRHEQALLDYDRAIALSPDHARARWIRSLCLLAMGDYQCGWIDYEWRWKIWPKLSGQNLHGPAWFGDSLLDKKTILIRAEQGFGDSLQFCRYVPMLAARSNVILEVPQPLVSLLSTLDVSVDVITVGDKIPRFDLWLPMMSLPLAFRTTIATIPASIPYLRADPERSAAWKKRLSALPGKKIGLVWAGLSRPGDSIANAIDRRRSITIDQYAPLSEVPGVCLISLQKGEAAAQLSELPGGGVLHDWTNELDDFADTAALVEALDLVISVDTAIVHLAGALGKPVWILNRHDQCWRWLRDRSDSPWYPSARLFRQPAPGDWTSVIREVARSLSAGSSLD